MFFRMMTVAALVAGFPVSARPQSAPPSVAPSHTVIRVSVNLVQVDAAVTDAQGRPITDLQSRDFELLQDGKPQTITNFSYFPAPHLVSRAVPVDGKPAPPAAKLQFKDVHRTIALVVDDLGLTFEGTARVRTLLKKYVDTQLQPGDLVAIMRTGAGVGALQQFTTDPQLLYAAIDRVRFNLAGGAPLAAFEPIREHQSNFPTGIDLTAGRDSRGKVEFDEQRRQIFTAGSLGAVRYVVDGLRDLPGRKVLVLFSESAQVFYRGEPSQRVQQALRDLVDAANRSAVVIYTIDCGGLRYLGPTAADDIGDPQAIVNVSLNRSEQEFDARQGLVVLAAETGGLFLRNTNDLDAALRHVIEDSGGYYLIGYRPDAATFDLRTGHTQFHSLKVRVLRPGLHVRSRSGFFGVPDSLKHIAPRGPQEQLLHALVSPFSSGDIHVRLTALFRDVPKLGPVLDSMLYINARELHFTSEPDGAYRTVFDLMAVIFDEDGRAIDNKSETHTLHLKPEVFQRVLRSGLVYGLRHPLKKHGAYQVRVAVLDGRSGQVGSASQFLQVPDIRKDRLLLSSILLLQDAPTAAGSDAAGAIATGQDPNNSAAIRIFKPGTDLTFAYQILNAHSDGNRQPELESQVRVFRDGEQIYSEKSPPATPGGFTRPRRLDAGGGLQLGPKLTPGDYVLQVIVTDKLAKQGHDIASQSMDFEVQ